VLRALALVCAVSAAGAGPTAALGQTATATVPTTTTPSGLVPTHFAPIPGVAKAPSARTAPVVSRRLRIAAASDDNLPRVTFRFERPSPPAFVGPAPARPPATLPASVPPSGIRSRAGTASPVDLTALVWVSFFAAAVIAGTFGVVYRIRRRPSTAFGRPTDGIDDWLASAELAATRAPPPVAAGADDLTPGEGPDAAASPPPTPDPAEHG